MLTMAKDKSKKLTKQEKSWVMYDWANSVYATNIMAAIYPIYFAAVCKGAGVNGDVWWGYGTSIATAVVAILAPILGSVADFKGMKKKLLGIFMILGVTFTLVMAVTPPDWLPIEEWKLMLIGYVVSYIGFAGANLFYDSFLTDVTTEERMDKVSAWGYAMGYIGGSTIPFLISIGVLLVMGMDNPVAVKISVVLTAVWWLIFSLPILFNVKQTHYIENDKGKFVSTTFKNLWHTLLDIFRNKAILLFIIAYFFYIDGVGTVIHMATSYGSTIGLGTVGMILALLVTQLVAAPCSILFSKLANMKKIGSLKMIAFAICVYIVICSVGFYMGYSLEQKQIPFDTGLDAAVAEYVVDDVAVAPEFESDAAAAEFDALLNGTEISSGLISQISADLPSPTRVEDIGAQFDAVLAEAAALEISDADKALITAYLNDYKTAVIGYVGDVANTQPYDDAINFSSALFWAMAVLVGTVQGGIQALSRSFFGKLVPAEKSNEYFGFFDIFGKFAAVIGPALYAFVRDMTGRPSLGILSLIILFAIGAIILICGRKKLSSAVKALESGNADTAPAEVIAE